MDDLSAISFAFHAVLTSVVQTAVAIADTSAGSPDRSVSTKLSESSIVPGFSTYLSKDLVSSVPSFVMTVALRFVVCLLHRYVFLLALQFQF